MRLLIGLIGLALLAACSSTPKSIVQLPTSTRPTAAAQPVYGNGAIFQAGAASRGGLFEDRVARQVGDILNIAIEEKLNASTKSNSNADRTGAITASANPFTVPYSGGVLSKLASLNIKASSDNKFEGKGESNASNVFTGSITVTVVEVLPNGNLIVAGEKQIAIHNEHEFLRFSGVVNPSDIKTGNTVSSTKVADARIEHRATGVVGDAQDAGWLQKFFLSVMPF
ncbi:flagellar basal body L-ring protein FlgH [Chitinivorax sp. PXF-14]|uniref:flagellar basal body L-ring protein FlgH n=1 Tax=Chitinivorax sp. PXF-14 TaxID=3230488 RepID=UPI00346774FF